LEDLGKSIIKIGNTFQTKSIPLNKYPIWIVNLLRDSYIKGLNLWQEYIQNELREFCKTEYSKLNWHVVEQGGLSFLFTPPLTFEQKLWIGLNKRISENEKFDLILHIRDSLLPWLNYELWKVQEKSKKNKRTNIDYDKQRKALVEGRLEELNKSK